MLILPKGTPLFENLAASRLKLPEVMTKLSSAGFTGYASFLFHSSTVILVFESGKLVSALQEGSNGQRQTGFSAMSILTEQMIASGSGSLNVYKLSRDLAMCIHALLQGEMLYKAQELKLIDIKALLDRIKTDRMNGCLRIYTDNRSAMIFYKDGTPLGFFHDGSHDIETSSTESQKIAALPGAKLDLFSTAGVEQLMETDLLEMVNLQKLWDATLAQHHSELTRLDQERSDREAKAAGQKLANLEEQIKTIAIEHMGKVGRNLVDKELAELGGASCLLNDTQLPRLLSAIERASKLLISATASRQMMEKLTAAISTARAEF